MPDPNSTTGDIQWDWSQTDPKTVTLWNKDRGTTQPSLPSTPEPTEQQPESEKPLSGFGRAMAEMQRMRAQAGPNATPMDIMRLRQQELGITPEDSRAAWHNARRLMKDPDSTMYDRVNAFSDMLDGGLMYLDENGGLYGLMPGSSRTAGDMIRASKEWLDAYRLLESGMSPQDLMTIHGQDRSKYYK